MKRYLKIFGVAFLAGVGAARVLIWLNMGIVHLLVMQLQRSRLRRGCLLRWAAV